MGYFVTRQNKTGKRGEGNMTSVHFQIPGCFGGQSRGGKEREGTLIQTPDTPLPAIPPLGPGSPRLNNYLIPGS